jgi:hypothetical protein
VQTDSSSLNQPPMKKPKTEQVSNKALTRQGAAPALHHHDEDQLAMQGATPALEAAPNGKTLDDAVEEVIWVDELVSQRNL